MKELSAKLAKQVRPVLSLSGGLAVDCFVLVAGRALYGMGGGWQCVVWEARSDM